MSATADRPTSQQVHVVLAACLGWTLDTFDFFIMAFVLREVAASFGAPIGSVALTITPTLACRAVGAAVFGRLADRYGRRPTLMVNVLCYSLLGIRLRPRADAGRVPDPARTLRRGDGR
jgi:SHS family lactate transporter-like MFS transporter